MKKVYVKATDTFLSGWGMAEGKVNKLVIVCDTWQEAQNVAINLRKREEMKYVHISNNKPHYDKSKYYVSNKTKADMPTLFVQK